MQHIMNFRDLTASWQSEICHDVLTEPPLQPLSSKVVTPAALPTDVMMPELIYTQEVFGVGSKMHFGFFT